MPDAPRLTAIRRHPVKALGGESLVRVRLAPGETLPGDRVWALAHDRSRFDFDAPAWAPCTTFLRGAAFPRLMAAETEGAPPGPIRFRHPDRPELEADPATPEGEAALLAWAAPLIPEGAPRPARLAAAPGRGMTDCPEPWLSLLSDASLRALCESAGVAPDRRRFRGNLWIDGAAPWAEMAWEGRELTLGPVRLRVRGPIDRCSAILASPDTGARDADLLAVLERLRGAPDFGVFVDVLSGGEIAPGDPLTLSEPTS